MSVNEALARQKCLYLGEASPEDWRVYICSIEKVSDIARSEHEYNAGYEDGYADGHYDGQGGFV